MSWARAGAKWRRYVYLLPLRECELQAAGGGDAGGEALAAAAAQLLRPLVGVEVCFDAFARRTPAKRFDGPAGAAKAMCTMRAATCGFVRLPAAGGAGDGSAAGGGTPALRFELSADRFLRQMCRVLVSTTLWLAFARLELTLPVELPPPLLECAESPERRVPGPGALLALAATRRRELTAVAAPPQGLCFVAAGYDSCGGLEG
eukprot:SAG22_NODE_3084_length_1955_cov_1.813578_1_plen_204_part_00